MKQEKMWQAEDDMRTLARAEEIKSDKQRLSTAKKVGMRIVKERQKELNAMQKIAKTPVRKQARKQTRKKRK